MGGRTLLWWTVVAAVSLIMVRAVNRSIPDSLLGVVSRVKRRRYPFRTRSTVDGVDINPVHGHVSNEVSLVNKLTTLCKI